MQTTNEKSALTASSMATFKACARKYQLAYELRLTPDRDSEPLRFGSNTHEALDALASGVAVLDVLQAIKSQYMVTPPWVMTPDDLFDWQVEGEKLKRLVLGYVDKWGTAVDETVATEMEFDVPLVNPMTGGTSTVSRLRGKIDKIINLNGQLAIREHKTTSDPIGPESDYWPRLSLDQQISLYMVAARAIGYDVTTIQYDVISKPGISPRKLSTYSKAIRAEMEAGTYCGEQFTLHEIGNAMTADRESPAMYGARLAQEIRKDPNEYYARKEIPRTDAELDSFRVQLWQTHQVIKFSRRFGCWPQNPHSCKNPWKCEFQNICFNHIDPTQGVPAGYRVKERQHTELGESNGTTNNATKTTATDALAAEFF